MEQMNPLPFEENSVPAEEKAFPTEKRELLSGIGAGLCGLAGTNFVLFGGFALGFALICVAALGLTFLYLLETGKKIAPYPTALLILCAIIALGFGRSDDGFVKFVMVCFLLVAGNLSLCLMAGQNRRDPARFATWMDAPRTLFVMGVEMLPPALRGLKKAFRSGGAAGKNTGAVLLGIGIAVPVLAVMIPLLISADAAFDALIALLPKFNFGEAVVTVLFGGCAACVLYTRAVALRHREKPMPAQKKSRALPVLTVNIALGAVCALFAVYLVSQLAYFTGGLSGILPEGYTMAQYARRGFFEMAWLCAIDLAVIAASVALVKKEGAAPLSTRLFCLFIGVMTLFFVVCASAKMGLYISGYGLTRLRVLTEVIMVFLGVATVVVCVWLFVPKLPYMKVILLTALIMGALVIWIDVDSLVASYNVSAYLSGALRSVDVGYLGSLSDGAIPHLARLQGCDDPGMWRQVQWILNDREAGWQDFRDWNFASQQAWQTILELTK